MPKIELMTSENKIKIRNLPMFFMKSFEIRNIPYFEPVLMLSCIFDSCFKNKLLEIYEKNRKVKFMFFFIVLLCECTVFSFTKCLRTVIISDVLNCHNNITKH